MSSPVYGFVLALGCVLLLVGVGTRNSGVITVALVMVTVGAFGLVIGDAAYATNQ